MPLPFLCFLLVTARSFMKRIWLYIQKAFGGLTSATTSGHQRSRLNSLQTTRRVIGKFHPTFKVTWKPVDIQFGRSGLRRAHYPLANAQPRFSLTSEEPQLARGDAELQSHRWLQSSRHIDSPLFAPGFVKLTAFDDDWQSQLPHHLNHYTRLMELHVAKMVCELCLQCGFVESE
jgi:hypothetical protein